jgi:NTP pyrophosphatase (non-canonical NTP hydrolase)
MIEYVKEYEDAEGWVLSLKLGEEVGEFHEAVLKHYGYLAHKELKEDSIHEAADVVNVIFGALSKLYPELSTDELLMRFSEAFEKKSEKYKRILTQNNGHM